MEICIGKSVLNENFHALVSLLVLFENLHQTIVTISITTLVIWFINVFLTFFFGEIDWIVLYEIVYALLTLCNVWSPTLIGLGWSVTLALLAEIVVDFFLVHKVCVIVTKSWFVILNYNHLNDVKPLVGCHSISTCPFSTSCAHNLISYC